MNTLELLTKLNQLGVQVSANKDKLNIRSPKGVITPELRSELANRKAEILTFLQQLNDPVSSPSVSCGNGLTLQTIGGLIGGFSNRLTTQYQPPVVDSRVMAQKLAVTFRPLPPGYSNEVVSQFRNELKLKLQDNQVTVVPWEQATKELHYDITIPLLKWKKRINTLVVKTGIQAVIDVERPSTILSKVKQFVAEKIYQLYCRFAGNKQKPSVSKIAQIIGWAEEGAAKYVEDPTNTQVITLSELDREFVDPQLPYQQKIGIGLNTLIRTFSELFIGISSEKISILNMNLSDSIFARQEIDRFVLNSLIPKIYVPIMPLPLSRFELGEYAPEQSTYAQKLVTLSQNLANTGVFPPGSQLSKAIARKSHRDIVSTIVNGRTGVSYGFIAYIEAPQYIGKREISEAEWEKLLPVEGFSQDEVRRNDMGRRYLKAQIGEKLVFQQIPDLWLVSSRSGSNKTNLSLEQDVIRIGLTDKLVLQLPQGVDSQKVDIKPSYDVYVMVAIALAAALYAPTLIANGAPIVHFHGYPAKDWFKSSEYYAGVQNPSVPCGTYESGVLNFLGLSSLAERDDIALVSLIEPDHGTNVIASDLDYLIARLQEGCQTGQIELGGKHFTSLTAEWGRGISLEQQSCLSDSQTSNQTSPPWKGAYITKNQDSHRSDLIESSLPAPQAPPLQSRERVTAKCDQRRLCRFTAE